MALRRNIDFIQSPGPEFFGAPSSAQLSDTKDIPEPDSPKWAAIHIDGPVPNDRCIEEDELLRLQGSSNPAAQRILNAAIRLGLVLPDIDPPL